MSQQTLAPRPAVASWLAAILGGARRARRHAPMQPKGDAQKYITRHAAPTDEQLADHLAGAITLAVYLTDQDGKAHAWAFDTDKGGKAGVRARLEALAAAGYPGIGTAAPGSEGHDGGHGWGVFPEGVEPADGKAEITRILAEAGLPTKEVWPSGPAIRAPLGKHTHTGKRGTLIRPCLPDVDLDTDAGLIMGFEALATLQPSPMPPPAPPRATRPIAPVAPVAATTTASAGRASASTVIARFNQEQPAEALLSRYGATRTGDGWACNCGVAHTHETQLAVTTQGRIVFFSPRCEWAPSRTDRNGRPIADSFDLYTQVEHSGDKTAALKAYNPIAPRQQDADAAAARRAADAERKRTARRAEAAATLQAVRDRAAEDISLHAYPTAAAVLRELLAIAGERPWCSPSKAALAERLACSERTVQRALVWLEGRYLTTEEHTNDAGATWRGGHHTTPRRTFCREAVGSSATPQTAETGETRPPSSERTFPDEGAEGSETRQTTGGGETQNGAVSPEHREQERVSAPPLPRAPEPEPPARVSPPTCAPEPVAFDGGASFDPQAAVGPMAAAIDNWQALCAHWSRLEGRHAPQPVVIEADEPPDEVRGPPRDPATAATYRALLGKARKSSTSPMQQRALRQKAAALEEWYPASEAPGLPGGRPMAQASSRPRIVMQASGGRSPAPGADQGRLVLVPPPASPPAPPPVPLSATEQRVIARHQQAGQYAAARACGD